MLSSSHGVDRKLNVGIRGIAYALPERIEDGEQLKRENPYWRIEDIQQKTGVLTRHIADPEATAADFAVAAAEKLFAAGVDRAEIDGLIFVTQSPDYALPTTACVIQNRLRLSTSCLAFDVNLGCSGFIYGLAVGGSLIESGLCRRLLLLCADTYTKYIDRADRVCRPIFSDGGAATLLTAAASPTLGPFVLGTDGAGAGNLIVPNSGTRLDPTKSRNLFMDGAKVFLFTMDKVPQCVQALLARAECTPDDIDLFVFHQASRVVMENVVRRLGLPPEKVYMNLERVGNTVSASIPIALKDAAAEGKLKPNANVMLIGFGVGLSWGATLLRWSDAA